MNKIHDKYSYYYMQMSVKHEIEQLMSLFSEEISGKIKIPDSKIPASSVGHSQDTWLRMERLKVQIPLWRVP